MRFFFDVHNGETVEDEDGMECASIEDAIAEAGRAASAMSADIAQGGRLRVEIRDAGGSIAIVSVSVSVERTRPS